MQILQPDINISLNRGGSWLTVPDQSTGNSYFVDTDLNNYERAELFGSASFKESIEVDDWTGGAYVVDDIVRYGTSLFKCVVDTSDTPSKNTTTPWLWIAYSNKYAMLNGILESRTYGYTTTNTEFQDWEINFRTSATTKQYSKIDGSSISSERSSRMTKIAIMNLFEVDTVTITLTKSDGVTVLFNESYNVSSYYTSGTVGLTSYFDTPKDSTSSSEIGRSLVVDIPSVGNGYVKIEFTSSGDTKMRGVGGVFTGSVTTLGIANWGSNFDITQFSNFTQNDYGESTIVERGYKNNFTYRILMDTENIAATRQVLLRNRAYPCVYIGDPEQQVTINYGLFDDINPDLQYNNTMANLEIKGF